MMSFVCSLHLQDVLQIVPDLRFVFVTAALHLETVLGLQIVKNVNFYIMLLQTIFGQIKQVDSVNLGFIKL